MDINLHVLQHELVSWNLQASISDDPTVLSCTHPILYIPGMEFFSGPAYVAKAEELPSVAPLLVCLNLVCVGEPPADYLRAPFNVLFCPDTSADPLALLSDCMAVFSKYASWGKRLEGIVDREGATLRELGMAVFPLFSNPISLWTPGFKELFFIHGASHGDSEVLKDPQMFDEVLCELRDGEFVSLESLKVFASSEEFAQAVATGRPVVFDGYRFGFQCRSLVYPVSRHSALVAYLIVDEASHELGAWDCAMVALLSPYLARMMSRAAKKPSRSTDVLNDVVADLLVGQPVRDDLAAYALELAGWKKADVLVAVLADMAQAGPPAGKPLPGAMSERLEGALLQPCAEGPSGGDEALYVVNLTVAGYDADQAPAHPFHALPSWQVSVGVSDPFCAGEGLRWVALFARQARRAVELAGRSLAGWAGGEPGGASAPQDDAEQRDRPARGPIVMRYSDVYAIDMVSRCVDGLPLAVAIPVALQKLVRHDEEHDEGLTDLLRSYLECSMSATKTARMCYLSRNTCMAKVARIKEIMGVDFENPQVVLGLWMAVEALGGVHAEGARR